MSRRIEDVINDIFKENTQRNALDFIAHLREDEGVSISTDKDDDRRVWIRCEDKLVCEMQLEASEDSPGNWTVWFYGDCIGYEDSPVDERIKAVAWTSITPCGNCGAECAPGRRKTIFGKAFDNVCQSTLAFENPNTGTLACIKKIVDIFTTDNV